MSVNRTGDDAELAVAKRLSELGHKVSFPFGKYKYDLVADIGGELYRVQVKRASVREDEQGSVRATLKHSGGYGYEDEADVYCLYNPRRKEVYWIPVSDAPSTSLNVSIRELSDMKPADRAKCRHRTDVLLIEQVGSSQN